MHQVEVPRTIVSNAFRRARRFNRDDHFDWYKNDCKRYVSRKRYASRSNGFAE
jgi:hypothetical protein